MESLDTDTIFKEFRSMYDKNKTIQTNLKPIDNLEEKQKKIKKNLIFNRNKISHLRPYNNTFDEEIKENTNIINSSVIINRILFISIILIIFLIFKYI